MHLLLGEQEMSACANPAVFFSVARIYDGRRSWLRGEVADV
jgi:hypothetical protein